MTHATLHHARRLRVLSRLYHAGFVLTACSAVGLCASGGPDLRLRHGVLIALLFASFFAALLAQEAVWRTRCPRCGERFFARSWSTASSWAAFPRERACQHCQLQPEPPIR